MLSVEQVLNHGEFPIVQFLILTLAMTCQETTWYTVSIFSVGVWLKGENQGRLKPYCSILAC